MKRILTLILAILMLTVAFAGCKDDKAPSANGGGTTVTPGGDDTTPGDGTTPGDSTDPVDTTPKPDAEPPAPVVDPTYVNMLVWGDSVTACNNTVDVLTAFAKADGIIIKTFDGAGYDNRNEGTTYSLYELYQWDGNNADSKIKNINTNGFGRRIAAILGDTDTPIDYFMILTSRERGVALESANGRILTALKDLDSRYQTNNPNGKFFFLSGPAFQEGFEEQSPDLYTKWGMDKLNITSSAQHNELIKKHTQEMKDAVKTDSEILTLGDAFLVYYEKYYATTGIDLYADDLRLLSYAGSYFTGAYLYASIFGKSPAKIPVNAFLPEEEAKLLREIAHEIVFGTSASSVERGYDFVYIKEDTSIKEEYADEVYPEYYDELMAAVYAYENRASMTQYDQQNMSKKGSYSVRRMLENSYPENNSPQKFLYLDCSSFIYNLYNESFGYNFGGANRVAEYLRRDEACVFYFVGDSNAAASNITVTAYADGETQHGYIDGKPVTDEEALQLFLDTIQPGDVIAYGGHVILYVGNGQVMHCTSRQMGGATPDYNYTLKVDNLEMSPGGIVRDPIETFTEYWGREYRYLFEAENEVRVFRPLSLGLKPTEEAVARKENLKDIVAYKETSAFEGVTINAGGDVTITYTVKNIGGYNRTVQIVDTLPAALKYKSGDGSHNSGVVTIDIDIPAYTTKTFTYVVTVDSATADGTVIDCDTKMSGVRMNLTPITVGNTLSATEQAGVLAKAEAAAQKSATDFEFIKNLYKDGFNYELPFTSAANLYETMIKIEGEYGFLNDKYGMTVSPLFGGYYLSTPDSNAYQRLQYPFASNFVAGDIIVINPTGEADKTTFWICAADNTFMTVENGKAVTLKGSNTQSFRESLMGNFSYFVLRPSLTYFKAAASDTPDEGQTDVLPVIKGNVLIVGDMALYENDLTSMITAMLGSEYNVYNEAYNATPSSIVSRMEPYELFKFLGSTCNGWSTGARGKRIAAYIEAGAPEYIVIDAGRRDSLNPENSASTKTAAAIKWLSETYPNSKILVVAAVPYPDGTFELKTSAGYTVGQAYIGKTAQEHANKINTFTESCANGLGNAQVVKVSDAFIAALSQGLSVYSTAEEKYFTHPNQNGSYLISCMLYKAITGKAATGLAFASGIDGAKLQAVADGNAPTTPTEPTTPDTPDTPAAPAASVVKGNVLILGDMTLYENELTATLTAMLGSEYNICNQAYAKAPTSVVSRMEPYEVFSFSGSICTGIANATRKAAIAEFTASGDPECIIIDSGRRDTLNSKNSASTKTAAAIKWLSETYPNSKILVVASVPYPDNSFELKTSAGNTVGLSHTGKTAQEHANKINAFSESCVEGLGNAQVVKVSDGFIAALSQGLSVYSTAEEKYFTHPNQNGTYLISCILYKTITGKTATGLAFSDGIDGAKLQAVADGIK